MKNFSFNTCRSIINETGSAHRLGDICRAQGIYRPLVITDPGIKKLGLLEIIATSLTNAELPFHCYADVVADPPEAIVLEALKVAKEVGADGIIGFGGGSSMDTAKIVALLAGSEQSLSEVYGVDMAKGPRLPLILVPTTAGTGSEVTAVAIVTTGATTKMGVVSPHLYPDIALLDAELTLGLPPRITAMTGIDAMVHAIEAFTSIHKKNLISDMLAKQALKLLGENILSVCQHGDNIEARQAMLLGACLAGQAFANAPVAAVHALAYPLGGHYHIPHGLSNSLVLPAVLRYNASHAHSAYAELAETVMFSGDLAGDSKQRCEQFIEYFEDLINKLELPARLSQLDIAETDLPMLARDAMLQQRLLVNNPRPISEPDALAIYQACY
ncbi:iron-containing alcohol dehydrogenase [Spongiibacter sp. KMU-158]|uniref:Iron-containing alcohol dehydrogenase n=1 Tax=Spongiibacter pelagi TaxID=2760804 RepID=A0A927GWU8_9GAMM|nr:iron-containing alcohol dehydrogenase [Spongiibacter pelagi]MBD2859488.1 iron-containing alcohol dehydrogenase [Spongiibacter pelagi]